ncbi:DedA family protein [Clostridium sp. MT-14]|jgi:membrane protein DedA with SNARE-associated domain|uniref:DedA family protein n=1 Tax=Clostridium aromativorans TaxID=2836848 RepID=A0ABS8N1Q5_9CLOT|nr:MULTISPECIES: DedA family protein [Clostridium]KAA8675890.1 DedA family protein [Clostridium sp. HV4-5-A1G]MCC9293721.1 DedA family protein [Clostridium aromativorans]CAB1254227.1 Alkaline phosphatase [Clostridiaceae bacterium BL-3]
MVEKIINVVIFVLDKTGYTGIFMAMALESACIPIPSEAILPFGGYLSFTGRLNPVLVIIFGTLGGTMGSIGAYYIGKIGGRPLVEKYADKLRLSRSHLEKSDYYFNKYGEKIVFFSRLLPIIRTFISLPAGISKMEIKKFVVYTLLGSLLWSIFLGYAGYKMGEKWTIIREWFHFADIALVVIIIGFVFYKIIRRKLRK